ncbi:DUF2690 domain-containing protein [Streptomyces sp. NPDC001500]
MTPPPPERVRLACALRDLRRHTELSMAGLAAKTTFSKSSWERYLNGRTLPPRAAVEELCGLAGESGGRCLALWELADAECRGRAAAPDRRQPGRRPQPTTPATPIPTPASFPAPVRAAPSRPTPLSSSPTPPPTPSSPAPTLPPTTSACAHAADDPASGSASDSASASASGDAGLLIAGHRGAMAVAVLASVCAVVAAAVAVLSLFLLLPHPDGLRATAERSATGPLCQGADCAGGDPMRMNCARVPVTLALHRTAAGAWLELRYSQDCGAAWARTWGTRIGDRLEMTPGGRADEIRSRADTDAYVYTPMSAALPGTVVRACLTTRDGGPRECVESRVESRVR